MSENELEELLALPEYSWVKEDLLPTYYVLSKMGFGIGNGYQFLPTSEENLLINLRTKRALSELREFEQIFAGWIDRERVPAVYQPSPRSNVYTHGHHSGDAHEIRINITGPLLNIGKEQFKMIKMDLGFDFEIKTIYDLFFFKYLLSNVNVKALEDTGLISIITKDEMWESWSESAAHSAKSLVRKLISCNKAFLSDAVIGTMASKLMGDREIFYEFMDSIPERYKVVEHDFNSSSCYLYYKYAIPSEVWNKVKSKIDGIEYVSIIKPSLSKLEEEYGDILNEIKFLELLKQEKVDANNRMKIGDYERFSDVIERLNIEGFIKIASTGDIILLVEGETVVTRISSLMGDINEMILGWLNEKVEPELGIEPVKHPVHPPTRPVTEVGKTPGKENKDIIIGSERESEQWGIIGKSGGNVLMDLNAPHIIFVCGKMGYGKGYIIGVLCEMLASHTIEHISRVLKKATIIVFHRPQDDVRSEFWSMVYPNDVESEIRSLKEYNASPSKLFDEKDFRVFLAPNVYENVKEKFEQEYETKNVLPLSLEPSKLSAEDWGIALSTGSSGTQYIKTLFKILEELQFREFTVNELKKHILDSKLNKSQKELAIMRIELVEDFLKYGDFMENLAIGGINVVDLRKLMKTPDDIFAIMTLMLSVIQSKKGFEDEPFVFVINEAHEYFRKGISKEFVDKIEHLIRRKRHGANWLLLDTHKPDDVSSNVVMFSDVKIIHRMDTLAIKRLRDINVLTKKAEKSPDKLEIGEAIVVADESSEGKSIPILLSIRPRITEHGGATKTAV